MFNFCSNLYLNDEILTSEEENNKESIKGEEKEISSDKNTSYSLEIEGREVYDFIHSCETEEPELTLSHSYKDFVLTVKDCKDSGGDVYVVFSPSGKVYAVGYILQESDKIKVKHLYSKDRGSELRLLHELTERWPDIPIEIVVFPDEAKRKMLEDQYYVGSLKGDPIAPDVRKAVKAITSASLSEIYGMARILDFSDFMEFLTSTRRDSKFSILMKGDENGDVLRFDVNTGVFETSLIDSEELRRTFEGHDSIIPVVLTENQVQSLLLRKSAGEKDTVTMAFGLPPVRMNMTLLLD